MTAMNPQDVETEITLMSKSKKILIRRAFLHEQIVTDSNSSETRFKIEIPDDDLMKISANPEQEMIALPMLKNKIEENHLHNKRVSHYEVDL